MQKKKIMYAACLYRSWIGVTFGALLRPVPQSLNHHCNPVHSNLSSSRAALKHGLVIRGNMCCENWSGPSWAVNELDFGLNWYELMRVHRSCTETPSLEYDLVNGFVASPLVHCFAGLHTQTVEPIQNDLHRSYYFCPLSTSRRTSIDSEEFCLSLELDHVTV